MFDLLVLVGRSIDGPTRGWNLLLLEIVYLLLRWTTPQSIWSQYVQTQEAAINQTVDGADQSGDSGERGSELNDDDADDRKLILARRLSQLTTASRLQEQFKVR